MKFFDSVLAVVGSKGFNDDGGGDGGKVEGIGTEGSDVGGSGILTFSGRDCGSGFRSIPALKTND